MKVNRKPFSVICSHYPEKLAQEVKNNNPVHNLFSRLCSLNQVYFLLGVLSEVIPVNIVGKKLDVYNNCHHFF